MQRRTTAACLFLLLLVGCGKPGPETFQVTGAVTYQGKRLPLGSVVFVPQEKGLRFNGSPIDANGRYQIEAAPGRYTVQVQMIARLRGQPAPTGEGAGMNMPEVDWLIPEKYAHAQTSGLEVTVEAGKVNQIDLALR